LGGVDRTDEVINHIYGKKLTWFEEIFEKY